MRGTTRGAHVDAIAATGAEPYVGDPDRIATLMEALHGVTIVCWLMGTIADLDLHAGRLRMFWEKLVDTPVRGVVYEGMLPEGEAIARASVRDVADPARGPRRRPAARGLAHGARRRGPPSVLSRSPRIRAVAPQTMWRLDLVDVGPERHPAPDEPLERVAGDEVVERELEHLGDLGLLRDPLEAVLDQARRTDRSRSW